MMSQDIGSRLGDVRLLSALVRPWCLPVYAFACGPLTRADITVDRAWREQRDERERERGRVCGPRLAIAEKRERDRERRACLWTVPGGSRETREREEGVFVGRCALLLVSHNSTIRAFDTLFLRHAVFHGHGIISAGTFMCFALCRWLMKWGLLGATIP